MVTYKQTSEVSDHNLSVELFVDSASLRKIPRDVELDENKKYATNFLYDQASDYESYVKDRRTMITYYRYPSLAESLG